MIRIWALSGRDTDDRRYTSPTFLSFFHRSLAFCCCFRALAFHDVMLWHLLRCGVIFNDNIITNMFSWFWHWKKSLKIGMVGCPMADTNAGKNRFESIRTAESIRIDSLWRIKWVGFDSAQSRNLLNCPSLCLVCILFHVSFRFFISTYPEHCCMKIFGTNSNFCREGFF